MWWRTFVVAALVSVLSAPAWAGFAQMTPPAGFTQAGSSFTYGGTASANAPFVGGSASAQVTRTVGGRVVTMPAAMRLAANAASFAVAAVRLSPGALAVGAVAAWFLTYGLTYDGAAWTTSGFWYYPADMGVGVHYPSRQLAAEANCRAISSQYGGVANQCHHVAGVEGGAGSNIWTLYFPAPDGSIANNRTRTIHNGGSENRPAVESEFAPIIAAPTMPDGAANQLRPTVPLPVLAPWVAPNPLPGAIRAPVGLPEPVPGAVPQEWDQPVHDIRPAPLPDQPFRVDVQPRFVPSPDATGITDPVPLLVGDPTGVRDPTAGAVPEAASITCGLPDTPPCVISGAGIESGSADGKFAPPKSAMDAAGDDIKGKIEGPVKPSALGWMLSASVFGFPAASCQPFVWSSRLGSISFDPCTNPLVNTVRGMVAWLLYGITLLYVWRRANEAMDRSA